MQGCVQGKTQVSSVQQAHDVTLIQPSSVRMTTLGEQAMEPLTTAVQQITAQAKQHFTMDTDVTAAQELQEHVQQITTLQTEILIPVLVLQQPAAVLHKPGTQISDLQHLQLLTSAAVTTKQVMTGQHIQEL